jgi:steroid 5-alpha reductase family enzyme
MRKLIPALAFELIHIFLVAIAQPMLLFALSLPVAALAVPGHMLSAGPWPSTAVRYGTLATWLPSMFAAGTFNPTTPVLHVGDALLALATLAAVALEGAGDNAMHAFQSAKHAEMKRLGTELVENPESEGKLKPSLKRTPKPVAVPHGFEPGFPTKGLHAYVRHPNFAGEQAFWLSQGLFALAAVTRPDALTALGPALMVRTRR